MKTLSDLGQTYSAMSATLRRGLFATASSRPVPAFRGLPHLRSGACDGCQRCVDVCPTKCLLVQATDGDVRLELDWQRCMCCGICAEACPKDIIELDTDASILDRTHLQ
jgi:formate hydrogenlyase subunit 6/NADH:ubiquinone oxidoreductase subunit I